MSPKSFIRSICSPTNIDICQVHSKLRRAGKSITKKSQFRIFYNVAIAERILDRKDPKQRKKVVIDDGVSLRSTNRI
jgi:phosphoribosylanthranilate isomerase